MLTRWRLSDFKSWWYIWKIQPVFGLVCFFKERTCCALCMCLDYMECVFIMSCIFHGMLCVDGFGSWYLLTASIMCDSWLSHQWRRESELCSRLGWRQALVFLPFLPGRLKMFLPVFYQTLVFLPSVRVSTHLPLDTFVYLIEHIRLMFLKSIRQWCVCVCVLLFVLLLHNQMNPIYFHYVLMCYIFLKHKCHRTPGL